MTHNPAVQSLNQRSAPQIGGASGTLGGLLLALALLSSTWAATAARAPVILGAAGSFAILSKTGISTVPPSAVTGDLGVSPIDSTAITGFSLTLDATTRFATSPQVTGTIYAANYTSPTPANLTTAIGDMETAFTDAAGRSLPDFTELGAGNIGGLTLTPGLYKWGTGVSIPTDVTIAGGPTDVWIFQIAGSLTSASAVKVLLTGGAQAKNIFWQVAGGVGVDLGTTSHMEGIILAQKAINLMTGASINGRLLSQTAVTLDANSVVAPAPGIGGVVLVSSAEAAGPYLSVSGQTINAGARSITTPVVNPRRYYRILSDTALTIASITVSGGNVVVIYR